jgi:DNA-binding MarR family transcriptional regulator
MAKRTPRADSEDVLDFLRLIWEMNHHLQSTSKRMSWRLGVTGPQRLALRMVGREPGMPTLRLAALLHLHPSTVTGILDRLESAGLVRRTTDPADARSTRLRLTRRGVAINRLKTGTVEGAVAAVLQRLPPSAVTASRDVLAAVCSALEHTGVESRAGAAATRPRLGRRRTTNR